MNLPPGVNLIDELRSDDRVQTLRAQPLGKSETVIVKIIHTSANGSHIAADSTSARLRQWQGLTHRSIVRPTHIRHGSERLVLMLPDISTGSLADRLEMGAVSSLDIGEICHQACAVLQLMHNGGMSHGNLKPSNLLIDVEGNLLVTDPQLMPPPGLLHDEPAHDERVYLAPEVIAGASPSPPADQYSLALILLTLLTRQPPDQAARVLASMAVNGAQHHAGRSNDEPFLPARAVHTLRKALTVDAENRWPSLAEFNQAFQAALGYQDRTIPVPKPSPQPEPQPVKNTTTRPSNRWPLAAAVLAMFLCALLSIPAYSLGWLDRGWAVIAGQFSPGGQGASQVNEVALDTHAGQATPTAQSLTFISEQDGPGNEPNQEADEWGSSAEPTKEQVSVDLPPPPPPTATSASGGSGPDSSQDPVATSTPVPTSTPDDGEVINPNSCSSNPNHPRYCTPTPSP